MKAAVTIEKETTVVPLSTGLKRAMLGVVRHPDGSIYVNPQTHACLYKSTDSGETWARVQVSLPATPGGQTQHGLGVTRDGRLWLLHQTSGPSEDLFVSCSADGGGTWKTTPIDFGRFAPTAPEQPYARCYNDYNCFVERPDGALMCSAGMRYDESYYEDPEKSVDGLRRPEVHVGGEVMFRSIDGGKTWDDPTLVHGSATEVGYGIDPKDPDRMLAMTRIQRALLAGEDRAAAIRATGCPPDTPSDAASIYKNGLLLESTDGGRTFHEVPGGLNEYYGHRGTILWTEGNVVVVTHQSAEWRLRPDGGNPVLARISLDGGHTWVDDGGQGTPHMAQSRKFVLVPSHPGHSFTAPTVELAPNSFLTVYWYPGAEGSNGVNAFFWRLETFS